LPTKAHFSSNWTSRVLGGKSHEFVVEFVGVLTGHHGQADDRILVDPDQAAGLPDSTILLKMVQHRHGLLLGESAAVQGGALAFREALLAGPTSQDPGGFTRAVAEADPQVVQAPTAEVLAFGVLAAEGFQLVHSSLGLSSGMKKWPCSWICLIKQLEERQAR
jgi:hypothetical protein